jgi:hypothetical protein
MINERRKKTIWENSFIKAGLTTGMVLLVIIPFELFGGNFKSSLESPKKIEALEIKMKTEDDKIKEELITQTKIMNECMLDIKEKIDKNEKNIKENSNNINDLAKLVTRVETVVEKLTYKYKNE